MFNRFRNWALVILHLQPKRNLGKDISTDFSQVSKKDAIIEHT